MMYTHLLGCVKYVNHQNISQYQLGSVLDQLGFGTETKKRKNEIKLNKQK